MKWIILLSFLFVGTAENDFAEPANEQKKLMIDAVNSIRGKGCYCGKRYMEPVQPIVWDGILYKSAFTQAKEMKDFNFFAHFSKDGLNIGERLQKAGYNWMVAGENLGEGQKTFEEVLHDWLKSYQHCTMLMHPRVEEMAVAKVDKYWVQHFGKKMPEKNKQQNPITKKD
ncbi:MAG: CAP domain-containing protein [Saprospiraceae bacterium]|jgi:uncharacterized protein YkwD|nr:hypothetical protein [Saprospiraceae bacterium]MBP6446117.1 hypothetical protein [Saprospiraceae bacterium]